MTCENCQEVHEDVALDAKRNISGQFRVTVPDAEVLDQLRTRGGVYRRGLYTAGNRGNPLHLKELNPCLRLHANPPWNRWTQTMLGGPLKRIYRRIRQQAGLSRSGSVGDVTLQPEPLGVMTQGRLVLQRRTSEQPQAGQSNVRNPDTTAGAVGGDTLLNIPPCSMAEGPGEQSQSLFRPPMSDPEVDLECWRGARPKVAGPLTTQTTQEEAKAASTEERVLQLQGTDFYLPLGGQPRIWKENPGEPPS